jgi:hypothetical protein
MDSLLNAFRSRFELGSFFADTLKALNAVDFVDEIITNKDQMTVNIDVNNNDTK